MSLPAAPLAERLRTPALVLALTLAASWAIAIWRAPVDEMQGVIQTILYVHVPCAFAAYLGFALTALGGALYLWRGDERYDRLGHAAAEVGVLFCALVIVTGPIWARGTWGRWWSWDPRLTVTLLLLFVYVAYLLVRSFTEGSERGARFAAVYGIMGLLAVPLNYFAIELFGSRAVHPDNLGRGSLGAGMGLPFALGVCTALAAFAWLVILRVEVGALRDRAARATADAAEDEAGADARGASALRGAGAQ
jgi:heme exporter protein C